MNKIQSEGYAKIYEGVDILVLSYGHLLHRAKEAIDEYNKNADQNVGLIDIFSIKPISQRLKSEIENYKKIITYEEQCLNGGFGSAIVEYVNDLDLNIKIDRIGLKEKYYFENGGREYLLDKNNLSKNNLINEIKNSR